MKKIFIFVAIALAGYGLWRWTTGISIPADAVRGTISEGIIRMQKIIGGWRLSLVPAEYRATIAAAEKANALPPELLARLLYQESHYRADIISGATRSAVGAIGIAQFMPATAKEWNVNPLDPVSSIRGAARYLAYLKRALGTWERAVAAYNWGIGNVSSKGLAAAPLETRNYYVGILSDIKVV